MEGRCPADTSAVKIESEDYLEQLLHKGVLFYEDVNCDQQRESNTYPPLVNNVDMDVKSSSNTFGNNEALAFEAVDVLMIKEEMQEITNRLSTNTNTTSLATKESDDEQPAAGSPKAQIAKKCRSGRVIGRQWEFLVDYMVSHPAFATGKLVGPQGAIKAAQQWTKLSQQLNELGPKKSANQWKKVWRDLKRNTKARAATINASLKQTGNINVEEKLTALDKKVITVIGWESNTGSPGLSTVEVLPDPCSLSEASSSPTSSVVTTNVDEPKPICADNDLELRLVEGGHLLPTPSTQNATKGSLPSVMLPCPQAEPPHTHRSTTKRKRWDDYEERFLHKFTQIQQENVNNARTTAEQMSVLGAAFTKIATATDRMATAIETMSTAITKLAESITNR